MHQDIDPELGEVPDLEGYCQREEVCGVKLGDELPKDQRHVLKDLVRRYPDVFTDMPGETDVIQHQIKLTDDTLVRCKPYLLPYAMREKLRNEVDTMLEMELVRLTTAEDLFRRLSAKKYLSKIELTKGYWQIPVAPEDVH